MTFILYTLVSANAVIIAGSGVLASAMNSDDVDEARREMNKGKALREFPSPPFRRRPTFASL